MCLHLPAPPMPCHGSDVQASLQTTDVCHAACCRQPSLAKEVSQPPLRCQAAAQRPVRCQAAATERAPFPLPEAVVEQPELDSNVRWLDLAQPVDKDLIDRLAEGFAQQPMQTRKTQAGPNAEVSEQSPADAETPASNLAELHTQSLYKCRNPRQAAQVVCAVAHVMLLPGDCIKQRWLHLAPLSCFDTYPLLSHLHGCCLTGLHNHGA